MLFQPNEKPVSGVRCVNCQQIMQPRFTGDHAEEPGTIARRDFVGYYCAQENCPRYGQLTLNYRLPAGEIPKNS